MILTDDGPYYLSPTATGLLGGFAAMERRDLTIKAGAQARPVIRVGREPREVAGEAALLVFRGGRIRLDGIEFRLDATEPARRLSAIYAENVDLSLARCVFRRDGSRLGSVSLTALNLQGDATGSQADVRPVPTRLVNCHFDGGQVGILARGPADIHLRDCTFGPDEPAFWIDNTEADGPVPVSLTLQSVRMLAGPTPVFQITKTRASVVLSDSVVAPPSVRQATLIATDAPGQLDWYGRGNLYGWIGTFLQPTGDRSDLPPIRSFHDWANDDQVIRESRSESVRQHIWAREDPESLLTQQDPSSAFRLADLTPPCQDESGPQRPRPLNLPPGGMLANLLDSAFHRRAAGPADREPSVESAAPRDSSTASSPPGLDSRTSAKTPSRSLTSDTTQRTPLAEEETDSSTLDDPMRVAEIDLPPMFPEPNAPMPQVPTNPMPVAPIEPMQVAPADVPDALAATNSPKPPTNERTREPESSPVTDATTSGLLAPTFPRRKPESEGPSPREPSPQDRDDRRETSPRSFEDPTLVRTAGEFRRALEQAGVVGGKIRLAPDADIELATVDVPRGGRWLIHAEPAENRSRPRLRFRPSAEPERRASQPSVLFRVAPGAALELQGVDLILEERDAPTSRRWAAFGIGSGTELVLNRCTVTVEGASDGPSRVRSAVVLVQNAEGPNLGLDASGINIRATDSLLRGGGDLVDVAPGLRLDLTLKNTLAACGASLVHGHGVARGAVPEPLKLMLSQVTSRSARGLIRLESTDGEPELPLVQVIVRDSILATTPAGDPLCVIEGQEGLETLRDRIRWESHGKVVYHQIETYRRDQTAQSGTSPVGFKRLSWEVAVGPNEDDPFHGDALFARPWSPDRPLWTLTPDDARLDPETPAPAAGPDLDLVPTPPPTAND